MTFGAWGFSSAGRASRWQRECQGFESPNLHHFYFTLLRTRPQALNSKAYLRQPLHERCRAARNHSLPALPVSLPFRHCISPRLSGLFFSLLLAFALFAASAVPVFATEDKTPSKYPIPDLVMIVWVTEHMDRISFTYQKAMDKSAAEAHLAALLRETGWTANDINIEDVKMADGSSTTTVEFNTLGTVNLGSGALPLEPIIKAFKDLDYLETQFVIPMAFNFQGLREYENKYVKILLKRGTNAYGYSIFIKDRSFRTLDLPLTQPEETATSKPTQGNHANVLGIALVVALGILTAVLVYFLMKRAAGPHTES